MYIFVYFILAFLSFAPSFFSLSFFPFSHKDFLKRASWNSADFFSFLSFQSISRQTLRLDNFWTLKVVCGHLIKFSDLHSGVYDETRFTLSCFFIWCFLYDEQFLTDFYDAWDAVSVETTKSDCIKGWHAAYTSMIRLNQIPWPIAT